MTLYPNFSLLYAAETLSSTCTFNFLWHLLCGSDLGDLHINFQLAVWRNQLTLPILGNDQEVAIGGRPNALTCSLWMQNIIHVARHIMG